MHRDLNRNDDIREELRRVPRGEMACVADPDAVGEREEDELVPDTVPETQPSPSALELELERARVDMSMAVWPDPI